MVNKGVQEQICVGEMHHTHGRDNLDLTGTNKYTVKNLAIEVSNALD